ncbi:MAG TPA: hypothetical protein VEU31_04520 [Candidatus Acidoferrales bacterium]|nr:hypothetical protein [Candidatus Acidoferrales bacterium]
MNRYAPAGWDRRVVSLAALLILAFTFGGCNKLKARDLLNKGVQAYKNGLYDEAIEDFKKSKELDPGLLNAQLYLATAYASQYIPGAPSDENIRKGKQAIEEFQEALKADPNNLSAIDGIGSILFQMAGTPYSPEKFEESKTYHEKHIRLKPEDPEPYYWVAVIDWTLAYRANVDIRREYNKANVKKQIRDEDPLPPKSREEYTAKYQGMVEEGISELETAIKLRPDYEDAMAYLNFLYRRKADMVESAEERASLIKQADDLLDKVKEIKQQKANQPQKS